MIVLVETTVGRYCNASQKLKKMAYKYDDLESDMYAFWQSFSSEVTSSIEKTNLSLNLRDSVDSILKFYLSYNEDELSAFLSQYLGGMPFYGTTGWWETVKTTWLAELDDRVVNLIKSYPGNLHDKIFEVIKNEGTFQDVVNAIQNLDRSYAYSKADFIARDLSGKINGAIQKNLDLSLGISAYLWQTRADEKVRGNPSGKYPKSIPSHWEMDSKVCQWNNPTVFSNDGKKWIPRTPTMPRGIPGSDWACRCSGVPFILNIVTDVDKEIEWEKA